MKKERFISKMNKLKSQDMDRLRNREIGVCSFLCKHLGDKTRDYFQEIFCPYEKYTNYRNMAYFLAYEKGNNNQENRHCIRDDDRVKEIRLNAILLFEAYVLGCKIYEEF